MGEEPPNNLEVQAILRNSTNEAGEFDPGNAWAHISSTMQFMASRDLDELIREASAILTDSPQWRHFAAALRELYNLQTKRPGIFRLLSPQNLVAYVDYVTCRKKLAIIFGGSPEHIATFSRLQSRQAALQYTDAILACNQALSSFRKLFVTILRELDEGLAADKIRVRNDRANLQLIEN